MSAEALTIAEPRAIYSGDPQVEDGYTRIANELMEALTRYPLPGGHLRVILALVRFTYGFNKKVDRVSYGQLAKTTGLHRSHVIRVLGDLVKAKVIIKGTAERCRPAPWSLNKHYLEWQPSSSTQATSCAQTSSTQATRSSSTQATSCAQTSSTQATHKRQGVKDIKDIPESETPPTPQQRMFEAICNANQIDIALAPGKRIGKVAAALVKAQYTPEQVTRAYGPNGWWYREDWRGKDKHQPPTPEQITETIKRATQAPSQVTILGAAYMMPPTGDTK